MENECLDFDTKYYEWISDTSILMHTQTMIEAGLNGTIFLGIYDWDGYGNGEMVMIMETQNSIRINRRHRHLKINDIDTDYYTFNFTTLS